MQLHANAKLGPSGRHALCQAIESGLSLKAAAAAFSVSPATAHRWWHRYLQGGRNRHALVDRTSRPLRCPRQLSVEQEAPILRARAETGYGPMRLACIVGHARSTVWKVLRRHGISRRTRLVHAPPRRYEWSRPGALLHVDVKRLARFHEPGHRATGDRREIARNRGVCELGLETPEAVMSDNALVYTRGERFQAVLAEYGIRHIRTPAYTPRWNGKVERFIQTLLREWAYVRTWRSSHARARALLSFVRFYNRRRPHGSLGGRPPISRVHNLCGQDS